MKFLSYSIVLFFLLIGCANHVQQEDIQLLNGFWEIESVRVSDGKTTKKYSINTSIDFFQIDDSGNGYRKKTKSDFSGKYKANNIKDTLRVFLRGDFFVLETRTAFDRWEETIISLSSTKLVLENQKGILFHYKKHLKYNLN